MPEILVDIYSFGFIRSGPPFDTSEDGGGFVFDCRLLPNPGWEAGLMEKCGLDQEVQSFLDALPLFEEFTTRTHEIIMLAVNSYQEKKFTKLQVAFGCTGGQHRSVYCAELLARRLRMNGVRVRVTHREQGKYW